MNERFIWKEGELEKISQEELENLGMIPYRSNTKHYCRLCDHSKSCGQQCDRYRPLANQIAHAVFKEYFDENSSDLHLLRRILSDFDREIQKTAERTAIDKGLIACIKIHFIDLIQFETMIDVPTDLADSFLAE